MIPGPFLNANTHKKGTPPLPYAAGVTPRIA